MRAIARWNLIFPDVIIPLLILTLYFVSFAFFLSSIWTLPTDRSVNYVFVTRSWKYLLALVLLVSLIYRVFLLSSKEGTTDWSAKNSMMKLTMGDLILLLLPLTPVVQYIINNQDILSLAESAYALFIFVVLSAFYIFAVPMLFGYIRSARVWSFLGLAFVYTLTSMAMLSNYFNWYEEGSLKIQWLFLLTAFLITWILANIKDHSILRLLIVIIFVVNSAGQFFSMDPERMSKASVSFADNRLLALTQGKRPVSTPNIYLLIYDSYVPNETMLAYGIDNSAQEAYLKDAGFVLYPQTYSVGSYSMSTMSRVLNASGDFYGQSRRGVSGDGVVQNILRELGYKTYGIFSSEYFFQGIRPTYDVSYPRQIAPVDSLINGIFMGEFRFDLGTDRVPREEFLRTKQIVFEGASSEQMFVYTHSPYPGHSQNSGACLPDETDRFATRLRRANIEMQQDLETIMSYDPTGVIIVAGDHGPYLTKNCFTTQDEYDISEISRLDVQDRFGTFLAIRWSAENFDPYDEITVLQDVFPAVFAYLFEDTSILEAKMRPLILEAQRISGVTVENNIIHGGIHDGQPLFLTEP